MTKEEAEAIYSETQDEINIPKAPQYTPAPGWMRPTAQAIGLGLGGIGGGIIGRSITGSALGAGGGLAVANALMNRYEHKANPLSLIGALGAGADIAGGAAMDVAGQGIAMPALTWLFRGKRAPLQEVVGESAGKAVEAARPPIPSSELYKVLKGGPAASIPLKNTSSKIDEVINTIENSSNPETYAKEMEYLMNMKANLTNTRGSWNLPKFEAELKQLGDEVSARMAPGGMGTGKTSSFGYLSQIKNAMNSDLEIAATSKIAGAPEIRAARQAYFKEKAIDRVEDYMRQASRTKSDGSGDMFINANTVERLINKDRLFTKAFSPAEQKSILMTLSNIKGIESPSVTTISVLKGIGIDALSPTYPFKLISAALRTPGGPQIVNGILSGGKGTLTSRGITLLTNYVVQRLKSETQNQPQDWQMPNQGEF